MSENNVKAVKYEFKAETQKLLDILVHSLYTNKEVFLRELVSNASDALDKVRFLSIKGEKVADNDLQYEINIKVDKEKNVIIISDTGIGMTKEEVVNNIGTIAKSGTEEFLKNLSQDKNQLDNMIGKFGVGFYSVFMIAEKVILTTKSAKDEYVPIKWISDGLGTYEIEELNDENITRGTKLEIYVKDEHKEFVDENRIKSILQKHSSFISFPMYVEAEKVNTSSAIWREPKASVTKEQYEDFYKFLTYDYQAPLDYLHISVEAPIQYRSLLFIPKMSNDFFGVVKEEYGLDLYINRVLIQHRYKELLPQYLGFIRGLVDSEDLPLNISRESIQESLILTKIAQNLTTYVLNHLLKMAKDNTELYNEFWKQHSKIFKHGYTDYNNRDKFMDLLRFNSSKCEKEEDLISLESYISNFKEGQDEIYYIMGGSYNTVANNPHVEIFKRKGIEVVYLYDPFDELMISSLGKYKEKSFVSVEHADLSKLDKFADVETKEKDLAELNNEQVVKFAEFLLHIKATLGDRVKEVKESKRLLDSPACLVDPDGNYSSSMQKIIQHMNKDTRIPAKVLEINRDHKILRNLLDIFTKNKNDEFLNNSIEEMFDTALMLDGYLNDPTSFAKRINYLLEKSSELYKK